MRVPKMTPDAAVCLDAPCCDPGRSGTTLFFFKDSQFFCWDVESETMLEGYPRQIAEHWPGLLESSPGPACEARSTCPSGDRGSISSSKAIPTRSPGTWKRTRSLRNAFRPASCLPSRITAGDFTPVLARLAGNERVIYGFQGYEYTRWTVGASWPATEDEGFPRRIDQDWKDGLVLAPRAGIYVDWPNRSAAHSNRKIYFFMGDLYLRWDVPSHTRNYRLDIASGWKGWPVFA